MSTSSSRPSSASARRSSPPGGLHLRGVHAGRHPEDAPADRLIEVLDVDSPLEQQGGDPRDESGLVSSDDRNFGQFAGHATITSRGSSGCIHPIQNAEGLPFRRPCRPCHVHDRPIYIHEYGYKRHSKTFYTRLRTTGHDGIHRDGDGPPEAGRPRPGGRDDPAGPRTARVRAVGPPVGRPGSRSTSTPPTPTRPPIAPTRWPPSGCSRIRRSTTTKSRSRSDDGLRRRDDADRHRPALAAAHSRWSA